MEPRERWQTLQSHLTTARQCFEAGDRIAALAAIDAALAIDPEFLAAQALRDRILSSTPAATTVELPEPREPLEPRAPRNPPLVSKEGFAQFEQRAKRRRVDRRLDAARAAIERGRLKEARLALDEVIELDPHLPELADLAAQLDALTRGKRRRPSGHWIAAAAVFAAMVLGATWLQETGRLGGRSMIAVAPLVTPPEPLATTLIAAEPAKAEPAAPVAPVATSGDTTPPAALTDVARDRARMTIDSRSQPAAARDADVVVAVAVPPPAPTPSVVAPPPLPPQRVPDATAPLGPVAPATMPPGVGVATAAAPAASPTAAPASHVPPAVPVIASADDEALVKQVLQRYRNAYEGLDARSARAVWPAVNETALARAFDGLQSQSLVFDACDVRLRGESAAATCRGSARYVTKVGNHDPRVEPRTWNFTLKKNGADWEIESARADR